MPRYNSLSTLLRKKFGAKVYKVSLDAKFTCPNRDGSKGTGGCIYCNPKSNTAAANLHEGSVREQLLSSIEYIKKRHRGTTKFIAYFQQHTNTYADAKKLAELYNTALDHPDIVGLAISTRPDCLPPETMELLKRLNSETFLWLELGLQSAHDRTLRTINRGHTVAEFENAIGRAHAAGIMTCAHIILGLPGETCEDMLATIEYLNSLKIGGVKIHNLHILKDTKLALMYERGKIAALTQKEYASLVVDCLERLSEGVIIHRFNGHAPRDLTIAPMWSVNKLGTLNAVHGELERRNSYQGRIYKIKFATPYLQNA